MMNRVTMMSGIIFMFPNLYSFQFNLLEIFLMISLIIFSRSVEIESYI